MIDVSFPISVIAKAIPDRFSGRASDGSVTVGSEEMKTKILLCYLHKCKKHGKEKRRSGGFVHYEKEIKRTLAKCIA